MIEENNVITFTQLVQPTLEITQEDQVTIKVSDIKVNFVTLPCATLWNKIEW